MPDKPTPDPDRVLPPILELETHDQGMKNCAVMTSSAILNLQTPSGKWYAAIVMNQPTMPVGCVALLDGDEIDAHIALLRNAKEDADRLNAGKAPKHISQSLRRH